MSVTWAEALDAYERLIIGLENGHLPPAVEAAYEPVIAEAPTEEERDRFQALQDRAVRCEQKVRSDMDEIQRELRETARRRGAAHSYSEH